MAVAAEEFEILRPFTAFSAVMQRVHFTRYGPAAAILAPGVSTGKDWATGVIRNPGVDVGALAEVFHRASRLAEFGGGGAAVVGTAAPPLAFGQAIFACSPDTPVLSYLRIK
jgi:hypothetical protein